MKKCVLDALEKGIDRTRCAEKYTRAERRYEKWTDESTAAAQVAQMKKDPKQPLELKMQFYCY